MFKFVLGFFCLVSFSLFAEVPPCPPQLKPTLNKILKLKEARELVETVQKEGPIRLIINNDSLASQFGAFWDPDRRVIGVSLSHAESEGDVIGSILFELHNALADSKLNHLEYLAANKQISRDTYVREIEFLEYKNSKWAAKLADKGIKQGIYPKSSRLPTYENFKEHFYYQRVSGHSAWIAKNYDMIVK